jgi:hypothetical protein
LDQILVEIALDGRIRYAIGALAGLGYNECVTYSFIDGKTAALFGGGADAVRIENPISSEMTHLRPDLLPGLLQAAARWAWGETPAPRAARRRGVRRCRGASPQRSVSW